MESYKSFFNSYDFETQSLGKICNLLLDFIELNKKYDQAKFSQTLPSELMPAFDVCLLYPLSKYGLEDSEDIRYSQEIVKRVGRLREYHLKDRVKNKI